MREIPELEPVYRIPRYGGVDQAKRIHHLKLAVDPPRLIHLLGYKSYER
jgi:hypothetical protein